MLQLQQIRRQETSQQQQQHQLHHSQQTNSMSVSSGGDRGGGGGAGTSGVNIAVSSSVVTAGAIGSASVAGNACNASGNNLIPLAVSGQHQPVSVATIAAATAGGAIISTVPTTTPVSVGGLTISVANAPATILSGNVSDQKMLQQQLQQQQSMSSTGVTVSTAAPTTTALLPNAPNVSVLRRLHRKKNEKKK